MEIKVTEIKVPYAPFGKKWAEVSRFFMILVFYKKRISIKK